MEYVALETDKAPVVHVPESNGMVEIEKSRAVEEVQAALVIAKKFPRDQNAAFHRIMEACKRFSLADQSTYSYPKGKTVVTGPSIRLAEVLAQNYGNLNFGVREVERRRGASIAESFCWDLETNVMQTKVFEVQHEIIAYGKTKKLTDPREVYELVANNGARRLRACILGIIPGDIVEAAVNQCKKTLAKGNGEPIADRVRQIIAAFADYGVSQEMIEAKLGHKMDLCTGEEIADLRGIWTALKDKQSKRGEFFEFPDDEEKDSKAAELAAKLGGKK